MTPYDPSGDWYEPGWCPLCGMPEDDDGKCLGLCGDGPPVADEQEPLFDELDDPDDEDDDDEDDIDDGEDLDNIDWEGRTDVT